MGTHGTRVEIWQNLTTQFFSMPKSNNTSRIAIEKKQKGRENKDI